MSIPTGIKDINGRLVHTGQKVKMHYFSLGLGVNGGAIECENEIEGVVRGRGYCRKNRSFYVETKDKIRYPFKLMQEPEEEIEIMDYE